MSNTSAMSLRPADRLRHSLLSQVGSQVLRLLIAIGIGGWLARYLGPDSLGKLSYVTALVGVFGPLGGLGVKGSLAALLCESNPLPCLVSTAFRLELLGTAILSLCLLPWALWTHDAVIPGLIALGVIGNFFNSSEVFETDLLNSQRGTVVAKITFLKTLLGALLTVGALLVQAPLLLFGAVPTIQSVIAACLLAKASLGSRWRRVMAEFDPPAAGILLGRGLPLLLAGLSIMLYMKSDLVMLEWLRGSEDVGQYSVAVRVSECLYFMPMILADTFLPRIGNAGGEFVAEVELRRLYRMAWLLGIVMMMASILLFPPLIPLVFGPQYVPAQLALLFLGPAAFAVSTGCASGAWLNANGHGALIAWRSAVGAIANVVLNLFLIPSFGIVGAAVATSLSQLLSVYLLPFLVFQTRPNVLKLLFPW